MPATVAAKIMLEMTVRQIFHSLQMYTNSLLKVNVVIHLHIRFEGFMKYAYVKLLVTSSYASVAFVHFSQEWSGTGN